MPTPMAGEVETGKVRFRPRKEKMYGAPANAGMLSTRNGKRRDVCQSGEKKVQWVGGKRRGERLVGWQSDSLAVDNLFRTGGGWGGHIAEVFEGRQRGEQRERAPLVGVKDSPGASRQVGDDVEILGEGSGQKVLQIREKRKRARFPPPLGRNAKAPLTPARVRDHQGEGR